MGSNALIAALAIGITAPVAPEPVGRSAYAPRRLRSTRCGCPSCSPFARTVTEINHDVIVRAWAKRDRKNALRLDLVARGALLPVEG